MIPLNQLALPMLLLLSHKVLFVDKLIVVHLDDNLSHSLRACLSTWYIYRTYARSQIDHHVNGVQFKLKVLSCLVPRLCLGMRWLRGRASFLDGRWIRPKEHYKAEPCHER